MTAPSAAGPRICHNVGTMKKLQLAYLIVGLLVVLSMLLALIPPPR